MCVYKQQNHEYQTKLRICFTLTMSLSSNPFNTRYPSNTVDIAAHHSLHLSGRWSSSNVQVQCRLDLLHGIQGSLMEDMMRGAMSQSLQSGLVLPVGIVGGHWCMPYNLFHFLDAGITRSASTSIAWFELEDGEMSLTLWTVCTALPTTADYITLHHEKNKKWSYIPKRECKFLSHQATSRKKPKRSYTYSKRGMQTSAAKPEKTFFWNFFGIHQDWNSKKIKHFAAKFFCKFFLHFFFWNSSRFS